MTFERYQYFREGHSHRASGDFSLLYRENISGVICDAQDLGMFRDATFDFIFSSNMLEHLANPIACLRECNRVLCADGIMVHSVPTRTWKAFNLCFSFIAGHFHSKPHGHAGGHLEEWHKFGTSQWIAAFDQAKLDLRGIVSLPFYMGHGNRFLPIVVLGNRLGLSGTQAFLFNKSKSV